MAESYDLVAIGSGTAATVAASRAAKAGWRTAIVDARPFGGTCALRGCDPKKMMVSAEEALDAAHRMTGRGVRGALAMDWPRLVAFRRTFTDPIPEKRRAQFAKQGIDAFQGVARFTAPDRLLVDDRELGFRHALIASGARPVPLGIPGEELVITSDQFFDLETLPRRIVFIGGGYIAAEFAHLAARGGAQVTILQRGKRLLPQFDAELVGWLRPRFDALGIAVHLSAEVVRIGRSADGLRAEFKTADGKGDKVEADLVVHAAGRIPDIAALDLAAADVAVEKGRLRLNPQLQSISNPRVYAAGDAAAVGPPLTPVSSHDGKVAADNMLGKGPRTPDYRGVPSVVFTLPPLASAGLSEEAARAQGGQIEVRSRFTPDWFTARRLAEPIYGHKTIWDAATGKILGAHLVGPNVEEVINIFALAIRTGLTAAQLKEAIFAYPTGASDIGYMLN